MPSCAQHMGKARSNLQFALFLLRSAGQFLDWAITGYFYSAVHLTEAYFDRSKGRHYGNHVDRRAAILKDPNISGLYNHYRQLETYSRVARYGIKQFDLKYIRERVEPRFTKICNGIEDLYGDLRV